MVVKKFEAPVNKIQKLQNKLIYQIFPRSFYDANNDGSGDLKGIIQKLGYLEYLGVNAIWLCPIYDTDFIDAGYDVKNYKKIWSEFGSIEDFEKLTREASKKGIDVIMDIVLNHVSNKHIWFKKACESTKNKEHEYFIWRKNLSDNEKKAKSIFGGSTWEYVKPVGKYYFHLFSKEQVDLNWENPETIQAMGEIIDFWYSKGVKGFRLDAIKHVSKDFPEGIKSSFSWGSKAVSQLQKFIKKAFSDKPDAFTLGESSGITLKEVIKYGKGKQKVADNFYNFSTWWIGWGKETGRNGYDPNWSYKDFIRQVKSFQESKEISPELMTNFLSNHDTSRAISRWGDENIFWQESAKSLALYLFSLKGIPSINYGEEIGMLNPGFCSRDEFRDVDALNSYKIFVDKQKIYSEEEMTKYHAINGRDNTRTPMQWSSSKNAGFNKGHKPWIKIGQSYEKINVENQLKNPDSILNFYKDIISFRKNNAQTLVLGESRASILKSGILKIERKGAKKLVSFINLTPREKKAKTPRGKMLFSSWTDRKIPTQKFRPYESILMEYEK